MKYLYRVSVILFVIMVTGCSQADTIHLSEDTPTPEYTNNQAVLDYDLPISQEERERYESDLVEKQNGYYDIYHHSEKQLPSDEKLSDRCMEQIATYLEGQGNPVVISKFQMNMKNYDVMENFIKLAEKGIPATVNIYEVHSDGGLGRLEFTSDGQNFLLTTIVSSWTEDEKPYVAYLNRSKVINWDYRDKGWFLYEVSVPEEPDVSEEVNDITMIRVKPLAEECITLCENYIESIGYLGNNMFLTNWDTTSYDNLDFNDIYEFLYRQETGQVYNADTKSEGIQGEQFEKLITKYIPIASEELRKLANYDEVKGTYPWISLGCGNYAPSLYGTPIPEVVNKIDHGDGTITLIVDAVWCEREMEQAFTHEVRIKLDDNSDVHYLGNHIVEKNNNCIPEYVHRTR